MNTIYLLKSRELCGADYTVEGNTYHIGAVNVDPEMAHDLLRNNQNRNVKDRNIKKICNSILQDGWDAGVSMLVFTHSGRLIDGQHRLKAAIKTQTPITTVYSVVPEAPLAMRNIDRGVKRSLADDLRLAGESGSIRLASTIRVAYAFYNGVTPEQYFASEKYNTSTTDAEYFRFFNSRPQDIKIVARYTDSFYTQLKRHVANVIIPTKITFLFLAFWEKDPEEAVNFFNMLSGSKAIGCPAPIAVLRQRLTELDRMSAKPSVRVVAAYIIKAWNAYISGESLTQITFRGGGSHPEKFPAIQSPGE